MHGVWCTAQAVGYYHSMIHISNGGQILEQKEMMVSKTTTPLRQKTHFISNQISSFFFFALE